MERIVRLSEQFRSSLQEHPDTRMLCWLGASPSEYKMINGFAMYHMSEESNLDDIFVTCQHPFNNETADKYGQEACRLMDQYIEAWNKEERLTSQTGIIGWTSEYDDRKSDAANFIRNMNRLAESFSCSEEQKLIVVILPQRIEDLKLFKEWIKEVLKQPIDDTVCFMLYDTYNERLFDSFDENYPETFLYVQPDLDLYGAVNQILENSKQANKDKQEQDVISFQQLLIKVSLAVSQQNEKQALDFAKQAIELTKKHEFYHLEALAHYYLYNLFASLDKEEKAVKELDEALMYAKKAVNHNIEGTSTSYSQYLIVKGNSFLFKKKYSKAIPFYSEALQINKNDGMTSLTINMNQMLGLCYRETGDSYTAYDHLAEGWKLIESTMNTESIREQQVLCYYAIEFSKVLRGEEYNRYDMRFEEIWGEGWRDKLKQQHKEHKSSFQALSVKK
jgi:tetratricopeptide (TPR) repeat protein